jgi:hypothetical protein
MLEKSTAFASSFVARWLWAHGYEEIIGPLGPNVRVAGPSPEPWLPNAGPHPEPWMVAIPQLIQAAHARALTAHLDGDQRQGAHQGASTAITSIIDDWCGTHPRKIPWPWPGPPPWTWEIAAAISVAANSLQEGALRQSLEEVAQQVVQSANRG